MNLFTAEDEIEFANRSNSECVEYANAKCDAEIKSLRRQNDNFIKTAGQDTKRIKELRVELGARHTEIELLRAELERAIINLGIRDRELVEVINNQDESRWAYWRKQAAQLRVSVIKYRAENTELKQRLDKQERALTLFFGRLSGFAESSLYDAGAKWAAGVMAQAHQVLEDGK